MAKHFAHLDRRLEGLQDHIEKQLHDMEKRFKLDLESMTHKLVDTVFKHQERQENQMNELKSLVNVLATELQERERTITGTISQIMGERFDTLESLLCSHELQTAKLMSKIDDLSFDVNSGSARNTIDSARSTADDHARDSGSIGSTMRRNGSWDWQPPDRALPVPSQSAGMFQHADAGGVHGAVEAMHRAAFAGHAGVLHILLDHCQCTDVSWRNEDGMTPLHSAAAGGHNVVCQTLLLHPRFDTVNDVCMRGWTALHYAAAHGHPEVCRSLLMWPGFQTPLARDKFGRTALQCASEAGHTETVGVLKQSLVCTKELPTEAVCRPPRVNLANPGFTDMLNFDQLVAGTSQGSSIDFARSDAAALDETRADAAAAAARRVLSRILFGDL